jgi:ribosomal protein S18 acetylase RimI-like enzyme
MFPIGSTFNRLSLSYPIKPFLCGDTQDDLDLSTFLFQKSKKYLEQLLAVTYILEDADNTIAFYSVSNDKITVTEASSNTFWKKHISKPLHFSKREFKSFPAVKIGKLAVNSSYQGQRIGENLINAIKHDFTVKNKTGCLFIIVDAINRPVTIKFYKKCGFDFLDSKDFNKDTRLMYHCLL